MAVKLRLARYGGKKKPFYRIVAADSEAPRDGKFLEILGHYNPTVDPPSVDLKSERVSYWISKGALATDTVRQLLKKAAKAAV